MYTNSQAKMHADTQEHSDGQLSFKDLAGYQNSLQGMESIENGDFHQAYTCFENLASKSVDAERFYDSMKAVKFWLLRMNEISHSALGESRALLLESEWSRFEDFLLRYQIKAPELIITLRRFFYLRIVDCYSYALEKQGYKNIEKLQSLARQLLYFNDAENALKSLQDAKKLAPHDILIDLLMADALAMLQRKQEAFSLFKKTFLFCPKSALAQLYCNELGKIQYYLYAQGFRKAEIYSWLPVYSIVQNIFVVQHSDLSFSLASCYDLIAERHASFRKYASARNEATADLLYVLLYTLDVLLLLQEQIVAKDAQDTKQSQEKPEGQAETPSFANSKVQENEIKTKGQRLLRTIGQLSPFFYTSIQKRYESFT